MMMLILSILLLLQKLTNFLWYYKKIQKEYSIIYNGHVFDVFLELFNIIC